MSSTQVDASLNGTLEKMRIQWSAMSSVCVVMASGGYPGAYEKGKVISGLAEADKLANTKVFHAGTSRAGEDVVTSGGRVLGVTAWGTGLAEARQAAYEGMERIRFEGAQFRTDIGLKGLEMNVGQV